MRQARGHIVITTTAVAALLLAACNGSPASTLTCEAATESTLAPTSTATTPSDPDRAVLVALYNATDGPSWSNTNSWNWLSDAPLEEWHGVTTDDSGGVTELRLSHNRLSGNIPAKLGSLSNLKVLELSHNQLSGEIPPELGSLPNLEELDLSNNKLNGEMPPELGSLPTCKVYSSPSTSWSGRYRRSWPDSPQDPQGAGRGRSPFQWRRERRNWPTSPPSRGWRVSTGSWAYTPGAI